MFRKAFHTKSAKDKDADAHDAYGQCPDTFYVVGTFGQHADIYRQHAKHAKFKISLRLLRNTLRSLREKIPT
jgi:hypothetical protein